MHHAGHGSPSSGCSTTSEGDLIMQGERIGACSPSGMKAVRARQGSSLTLGSILVFFSLRHFSAHRSQFGCVIPDLGKNRNPPICWPSSVKSFPEIRVLWGEKCRWESHYCFIFHKRRAAFGDRHIMKPNKGQWGVQPNSVQLGINENIQLLLSSAHTHM